MGKKVVRAYTFLLKLYEASNLTEFSEKCEIFFYLTIFSILTLQLVSILHKDCRSLKVLATLVNRISRHLQCIPGADKCLSQRSQPLFKILFLDLRFYPCNRI